MLVFCLGDFFLGSLLPVYYFLHSSTCAHSYGKDTFQFSVILGRMFSNLAQERFLKNVFSHEELTSFGVRTKSCYCFITVFWQFLFLLTHHMIVLFMTFFFIQVDIIGPVILQSYSIQFLCQGAHYDFLSLVSAI